MHIETVLQPKHFAKNFSVNRISSTILSSVDMPHLQYMKITSTWVVLEYIFQGDHHRNIHSATTAAHSHSPPRENLLSMAAECPAFRPNRLEFRYEYFFSFSLIKTITSTQAWTDCFTKHSSSAHHEDHMEGGLLIEYLTKKFSC